jgi:protein involved in ribonucleotide reduction
MPVNVDALKKRKEQVSDELGKLYDKLSELRKKKASEAEIDSVDKRADALEAEYLKIKDNLKRMIAKEGTEVDRKLDKYLKESMTAKEAIGVILGDKKSYNTSLNYAINYCKAALAMKEKSREFKVQLLYILNNLSSWRHPQAKEVRDALKKESK